MTDEQIIKALECCYIGMGNMCSKCSLSKMEYCEYELHKCSLDLIYRQKAEIERLKEQNTLLLKKNCKDINTARKIIKSEAIKEFVHRLKSEIIPQVDCDEMTLIKFVEYINNLVKEMTEVQE